MALDRHAEWQRQRELGEQLAEFLSPLFADLDERHAIDRIPEPDPSTSDDLATLIELIREDNP